MAKKWTTWYGSFAKSGRGQYKGKWVRVGLYGKRTVMRKAFNPQKFYADYTRPSHPSNWGNLKEAKLIHRPQLSKRYWESIRKVR